MASGTEHDTGSSVTLVFYRLREQWWRSEPRLNVAASFATSSPWTHVEIAIGEDAGENGEMSNVLRVFNDQTGVELVSRTGRNPAYSYISLGCSRLSVDRMLAFAKSITGRPFSNIAMIRSLICPRTSDDSSYFCAELVARALQIGNLLDATSNAGAATPAQLHSLYSTRAATAANPYLLRSLASTAQIAEREATVQRARALLCGRQGAGHSHPSRSRGAFTQLATVPPVDWRGAQETAPAVVLTLNSLDFRRK